jgi:hypothetical protein
MKNQEMGGFLNLNESFEKTFGTEMINLNESEKITNIYETPGTFKKYPKAVVFFNNIYMQQQFQNIIPILEALIYGDEVELSKVEEAFSFLERRLK